MPVAKHQQPLRQDLAYIGMLNGRAPENPVTIGTVPIAKRENFHNKGGKFGTHNLHENRPGSFQSEGIIFATYHNAGVRVFDISVAITYRRLQNARWTSVSAAHAWCNRPMCSPPPMARCSLSIPTAALTSWLTKLDISGGTPRRGPRLCESRRRHEE